MPKEENIPFLSIIEEVFEPVFEDYGFKLQGEPEWSGNGEYALVATKEDIEINFYLGMSQLFYYCSVGLRLSGELGEKTTTNPEYRNLSVILIAECLDPAYTYSKKASQTKDEVTQSFRSRKEDLLKYCEDILKGDVSSWSSVVDCLTRKSEKSKYKVQASKSKAPRIKNKPIGLFAKLAKIFNKSNSRR